MEATDFLAPLGRIEPGTWPDADPGGDTETRLEAWIAAAEAATTGVEAGSVEAAVTAYVYAHAYRAMAQRLAEAPATARQEDISHQISSEQIRFFSRLAERYEAEFETYLPVDDLPPAAPPTSHGIANTFVW